MKYGVLGGGLTGMALASMLGGDCRVLEAKHTPGGLCRTFFEGGFGFDLGGHILFSKDQKILKSALEPLGKNLDKRRRNNKIFFKNRFVKYPFENGLGELDKEDIFECLLGYLKNPHSSCNNFKEWILATFGDGIAQKYLLPYNEKIWKFPLDKMATGWVERVPKPPLDDILKSALGFDTEGYTHQLFFYYPKKGGIESLIRGLQKNVPSLETKFRVRRISKIGKKWLVSDGKEEREFHRIAICFPIHEAINCFSDVPTKVKKAVKALKYNSLIVVMIGIDSPRLLDFSAVYVPQADSIAHRLCFPGFFSRNLIPKGCSSLTAEITAPPGHAILKKSDRQILEEVQNDLERLGFLKKNEIVATSVKRVTFGYPIYDLAHAKNMKTIREFFDLQEIDLCGRFSEFEYINMDECFRRAKALADKWKTS